MKQDILRESERAFYANLDENYLSYDIIRPNGLADIVRVTAIRTGQSVSVYFDSVAKAADFWNHFDEHFIFPLGEEGVSELLAAFIKEIKATQFFKAMKGGEDIHFFPVKIAEPTEQKILETWRQLTPALKEDFDCVVFTHFLGKITKTIRYDADASAYILID